MPKVVDHESRRETITAAAQRLVTAHGLDAVTMASIASEAGISVGQLQHYFDSKDELLADTYRRVIERLWRRVETATRASVDDHSPIREVVLQGLSELLPLDEARASDHRVTLAFIGRTSASAALSRRYAETVGGIRTRLALAVHNGKECGEVLPDTEPEREALRLLALTDGLALYLGSATEPTAAAESLDLVRTEVERVFPGRCRQWTE